ncbi:MAG: bleomycin resistance protein [uncultured Ramlibacter sp.]|uniref:Bleomycin resistance protein n=1 Tax=uncultured Ramlibacter sp. TaxID=260755 RepID=A0A6J4PYZ6_9BURK|nr:MAG: bleomycin resistance protein [uncultured Ramlibacter sp.]
MSDATRFVAAVPVLASLDIERSVRFFEEKLGFARVHAQPGEYGIVAAGAIQVHFWACDDASIPKATGCRVQVEGIDDLHSRCIGHGIVHPNGPLAAKPWGTREFAILDPDGNLLTFFER